MIRKTFLGTVAAGAIGLSAMTAPVFVCAETVGPGGSIEADRDDEVEYDTGEGNATDHTQVDDNEDTTDETTESGATGSTNQSYVDDRTQDEKDLNKQYVLLRDLVASWKNKCTGPVTYLGTGNAGNNITTIQYGQLDLSDIEQAKGYLDAFNSLRNTGDVDEYWSEYYYGFDFRDSSSGFSATADPSVTGVDILSDDELTNVKEGIVNQIGLTDINNASFMSLPSLGSWTETISPFQDYAFQASGLGITSPGYVNGTPIRTDILPEGLNNAAAGSWYKDIESLYRYFGLETPESKTGVHGKFQSNAMNDFCSVALIRNYKIQEVIQETEVVGEPISDDYQIHLFSEDEDGNRTELDVLNTNQRINSIKLSDYPGAKKIIAQTYRKFNLTTYTRAAYAEYEYLIDVGTNNILWYSEHSMESNSVGKTGCRTITLNVTSGVSDWVADPDEAEIIIKDLAELTENDTITERVD